MQCAATSGRLHGNAQWQVQACSKGRCRAGKANCDQAKLHQAGQAQILCHRTWSTSQACLCQGMSVSCGPIPAGVPVLLSLLKLLYNKVYCAREWYLESMCVFIVMTNATGIYQSLCCLCVLTQSKHRRVVGFSTNPCSVMFHLICALFMPHRSKRCKVSQDDHIDGVCVQNKHLPNLSVFVGRGAGKEGQSSCSGRK